MEKEPRLNETWTMRVVRREVKLIARFGHSLSAYEVVARLHAVIVLIGIVPA